MNQPQPVTPRGSVLKSLTCRPMACGSDPLAHSLALAHGIRELFPLTLIQQWLVVESLQLGRTAGHEQVDDPLGLGGELQLTGEDPLISRGVQG